MSCLDSPVASLILSSPAAAGFELEDGEEVCDPIDAEQLGPVGAIRHLRRLELSDLANLGLSLCSTLRELTALTELRLVMSYGSVASERCAVFDCIDAMA